MRLRHFFISALLTFVYSKEDLKLEPLSAEEVASRPKKYLLYDTNPGEGFNLRRDVYMRVAGLVRYMRNGFWKLKCHLETSLFLRIEYSAMRTVRTRFLSVVKMAVTVIDRVFVYGYQPPNGPVNFLPFEWAILAMRIIMCSRFNTKIGHFSSCISNISIRDHVMVFRAKMAHLESKNWMGHFVFGTTLTHDLYRHSHFWTGYVPAFLDFNSRIAW